MPLHCLLLHFESISAVCVLTLGSFSAADTRFFTVANTTAQVSLRDPVWQCRPIEPGGGLRLGRYFFSVFILCLLHEPRV
jgi:hypothetical protein